LSLNITFEIPSWDEIYGMLLNIADKIRKDGFHPDILVGVSRGGLPPARVMSDLLGNPELASVRVEFYVGISEVENEPVLTQPVSMPVNDRTVLLLDDVVDTGKSLQLVKEHITSLGAKEVKTAAIYYKPWSIMMPDYYERKTRKWVVFPWERKETVRCLVRNCRKEGIPIENARKRLIEGGMDQRLVDRFINEVLKEKRL